MARQGIEQSSEINYDGLTSFGKNSIYGRIASAALARSLPGISKVAETEMYMKLAVDEGIKKRFTYIPKLLPAAKAASSLIYVGMNDRIVEKRKKELAGPVQFDSSARQVIEEELEMLAQDSDKWRRRAAKDLGIDNVAELPSLDTLIDQTVDVVFSVRKISIPFTLE